MIASLDHLRREIMAQPPADRLDYALDLMAFYLDPVPAFYQGCADLGFGLSLRDVRILHALDRRRGLWVSADALQAAAMVDCASDTWGSIESVYTRIGEIRRAFEGSAHPVAIERWHGVGYRLIAPAGFSFEALPRA